MVGSLSARRRMAAVLGGGFCGTITRYGLSTLLQGWLGKGWPYDILLINLTGAFLLAGITALAEATFLIGPTRRLFLNVGFLGAYTTFSSVALGDVQLFSSGKWFPALLYLILSLIGGIVAVIIGDWLGHRLVSKTRYSGHYEKETSKGMLAAEHADREIIVDRPGGAACCVIIRSNCCCNLLSRISSLLYCCTRRSICCCNMVRFISSVLYCSCRCPSCCSNRLI